MAQTMKREKIVFWRPWDDGSAWKKENPMKRPAQRPSITLATIYMGIRQYCWKIRCMTMGSCFDNGMANSSCSRWSTPSEFSDAESFFFSSWMRLISAWTSAASLLLFQRSNQLSPDGLTPVLTTSIMYSAGFSSSLQGGAPWPSK